jgi:large subunit ribosomal protein L4
VNRKARRTALRSALSVHAERASLALFDATSLSAPATKAAAGLLRDWKVTGSTLVVLTRAEESAYLSFRNLERVAVLEAEDVGVADLIGAANLLVSEAALPLLVARAIGNKTDDEEVES